ncbi:MAG: DUF3472 domain-containing protein [Bacteroidetes bacterium]|nr:DUF3472 domain-containing protein [Bacteroidota bacterium]
MKLLKRLLLFSSIYFMTANVNAQENAAPSMHLTYYFSSTDAILKMQKIKIVQSAFASFFEVNWFTNGYAGLQQTPDMSYGNSNILISSLWDPNTAGGIYSTVDYNDPTTFTSRFGGEGDGWKTINPYNWQLNTWYNLVNRSWKSGGRLYIATFINNLSTGKWFHTATLSTPDPNKYLTGTNDAFLENWDGWNSSWNGSFIRKAFFKDCWNLNTDGTWEKNTSAYFSANNSAGDIQRDGIYHDSFNAFYDNTEDAYCMQHGGNTTPSAAFNGGRTLNLPAQTNQGTTPTLTIGTITSLSANHVAGTTNISWTIDEFKSPQLAAKIEIIDAEGNIVKTVQDTVPQRRYIAINYSLIDGNYTARVTLRDIFNQVSQASSTAFTVTGVLPLRLLYFKGQLSGNYADLQWQSNDEINTSHFNVQRSIDGMSFTTVNTLQAANNSSTTNSYSYRDEISNINASKVYYRLQMFDKDGKNTTSNKVTIYISRANSNIKVSPNPVKSSLTISGQDLKQAVLIDNLGKAVLKHEITDNKTTINVSSLPKGIYTLIVTAKNYKVQTEKIIVE